MATTLEHALRRLDDLRLDLDRLGDDIEDATGDKDKPLYDYVK